MSWGTVGSGSSGFASEQISKVTTTVKDKLTTVKGWASQASTAANSVINGLNKFDSPVITMTFPTLIALDEPDKPEDIKIDVDKISVSPYSAGFTSVGQITFDAPKDIPEPKYGTAVESISRPSVSIPAAPVPTTIASPSIPVAPALVKPSAPVFNTTGKPTLIPIVIPEFSFTPIEPFSGTIPEYTPSEIAVDASAKIPEYDYSELRSRIDEIMSNDSSYRDMCKRMTDELVDSVDKETKANTDAAFDKWAAQNFSMVPGMLVSDVNDIQTMGGVKIREGQSKVNTEYFKIVFENFKSAVVQGIAIEKRLVDIYVEEVRQLLEIEKLKVKAAISMFDSAVAAFNAHQSARAAYATAYKAELEANLRVIESYAPLVQGATAEIAENEVNIEMFNADAKLQSTIADVYKTGIRALSADVEVYKASLIGVKAEADIISSNIAEYRDAVRAYSAGVDASSAEFSAYAAEVQSLSSGVIVDEANVRAYAAYVQESTKKSNVYRAFTAGQSEVLQADIAAFKAASNANEHAGRAYAAKAAAQAEIGMAAISAYGSQVKAHTDYNKAMTQNKAANLQFNLITNENQLRQDMLNNQIQAEIDKLNAGVKAAQAQALASLAQGSMSALHVQASSQGSGTTAFGANYSYGVSSSWGGNTDKTESKRQVLNA